MSAIGKLVRYFELDLNGFFDLFINIELIKHEEHMTNQPKKLNDKIQIRIQEQHDLIQVIWLKLFAFEPARLHSELE